MANFVPTPYNILSVSILLALLLFVQSMIKPFCGYWQNVLDEVLVLNLILLLSGYFYFTSILDLLVALTLNSSFSLGVTCWLGLTRYMLITS